MDMVSEVLLASVSVRHNDATGPGLAHGSPIADAVNAFNKRIEVLAAAGGIGIDFPGRDDFVGSVSVQIHDDGRRNLGRKDCGRRKAADESAVGRPIKTVGNSLVSASGHIV